MGFLDDLVQNAGAAGDWIANHSALPDMQAKMNRLHDLDRFAVSQGFRMGASDPGFASQYPELADEANNLTLGFVMAISPSSGLGAGAMGAAERAAAAAAAPGTVGEGALTAARAAQPQPGLPGMGSSQGSMPAPMAPPARATIPQGTNPNVPAPTNPFASQPPLPGMPAEPWSTLPAPGSGGMPPIQGPAVPPPPSAPAAPAQPIAPGGGYLGGPQPQAANIPPGGGYLGGPGPVQGPPAPLAPPAQPGMLTRAWQAAQANPLVAGAAAIGSGIGFGGAAVVAARANANASAPPPAPAPPPEPGPMQTPGADIGQAYGDKNAADAADRRRAQERNDMTGPQVAETDLVAAQAAYAKAQHDELDRRVATMDLTDSEKEQLHFDLQAALDAQNNAARSGDVATQESGANSRNAATIAGQARNTDVTEAGATARNTATNATSERNVAAQETGANSRTAATNATSERNVAAQETGANSRTAATVAGEARNTDVRETGANTRSGYEGQVTQRGQDINERNAQRQYVVSQAANLVARGQLSEKKAHDFVEDYIKREKLPSDILQSVSAAITPMLPYMRNGAPGDVAPGFESGGAYEQLMKMAGVKHPAKTAGYSDFNLADLAARYGGGPGQAQSAPLDLNAVYGSGPDTSEAAAAAYDQKNANDAASGAPAPVQMPSAIQNVTQQVAPMDPDTQQRIYNGIR